MKKLETIVFCPDTHAPFHNKKAWKLFVKTCRIINPDRLYFMGDFCDMYATSRHPKDPRRNRDVKHEIDVANELLDEVHGLGIKRVHFCLGNHEDNLRRYIEEKAPELFGLVSVPELFRFEKRGWTYSDYGEIVRCGKLYVTHDQDYAGAQAHEQTRLALGHKNVIIGHTHRLSLNYGSTLLGEAHVAAMCGWLGESKYANYMKPSKRKDWMNGFAVGHMESNGTVHMQLVPIIQNRVVVDGQLITL